MQNRSSNLISRLQTLGLSADEAGAYVTVLSLGLCKVEQISRETGLHRAQVYQMMPRLISIGLIEETVDRPKRYRATALRRAITELREQILSKYRELEQDGHRLIPDLEQIQAKVETVAGRQVRVITGLENMLRDFQLELDAAEEEVLLLLRCRNSTRIHTFMKKNLPMLKSKNLRARAILEVDNDNVGYAKWLSSVLEVRHHHPIHVHMHVVDDRTAALGLTRWTEGPPEQQSEIVTSYPACVKMIREFFEVTWKDAKPLNARLQAIQVHTKDS